MRRAALLAAAALIATALHPARAADTVITAAGNKFLPGDLTISQGSKLTFANVDAAPHNVVSDATTKAGAIFRSPVLTAGQSGEVKGVDQLKPGAYPFYCSLHPTMRGALTITKRVGAPIFFATPTGGSVPTPTAITFFNGAIYVTSYGGGLVTKLDVLPGGGLAASVPYATGFDSPLGLAFAPDGTLYVADSHDGPNRRLGRVWAVAKDGSKKVVIDGLPNGRHNTNNLAVRAGRLYVTNGNSTDDGVTGGDPEAPLSGTLLSYALPVTPASKPTVEAKGLRNVYDVAFRPGTSEAWFPTNGPDEMDPLGEDLLHKWDVTKGTADYGFPACVYKTNGRGNPVGPQQSPTYKAKACQPTAKPVLTLGLHVSANGVAFGPGGVWGDDLYIAEYGSNSPSAAGHRVVRVPIVNGVPQAAEDVVFGAAPLDVTFGPAGLYVADFASGAITLVKAT
jgi:glucose/arabinose dehydrogenase/plastocyanin